MTPAVMDELVRETYAVHYVLWNLGIEPDDIFVSIHRVSNAPSPFPYVNIMVKWQGREWNMWIEPLRTDAAVRQFEAAWHAFCEKQRGMTTAERDQAVASTRAIHQVDAIERTLGAKGIPTRRVGVTFN